MTKTTVFSLVSECVYLMDPSLSSSSINSSIVPRLTLNFPLAFSLSLFLSSGEESNIDTNCV